MLHESSRPYLPAAGHDWFLPFYDPLTKLLGMDAARRALLDQAGLRPQHRVLDVGCGTGTLAILIKRQHPDVEVVGLDPDLRALDRARRKATRAAVSVQFDQGYGDALAYNDGTFDRVFSCMMFHHLEADQKPALLREVHRVLRPGGRLEMLDFGGPDSGTDRSLARVFLSHHRLRDNSEDHVLALMRSAGFAQAQQTAHRSFLLGRIVYYQASR